MIPVVSDANGCQWLDKDDNYPIELAIDGGARAVITHNVRDLRRGEPIWDRSAGADAGRMSGAT